MAALNRLVTATLLATQKAKMQVPVHRVSVELMATVAAPGKYRDELTDSALASFYDNGNGNDQRGSLLITWLLQTY